ncbi:MAG TPA: cytochrome C oxidase subunit IV family protein [Anaerolineae bacterium]|nr:cytochrome C oxidase subunit IV family protein [Anaerolineae bacterium]
MMHHVVPIKVYLGVFAALMLLMAATIAVANVDLGILNNVVALAIALAKTSLIMLYFMHLRYNSRLIKIFAVIGFLFFFILVAFTLADYLTRGDFSNIAPTLGNPFDPLGEQE